MNKDLNYYYENAMSINDFLEKFYGRVDFRGKKLVHENIKSLFPDIKRGSFEDIVKNPELVYTGKVVLVRDCNNKCIPYLTSYDLDLIDSLDDREKIIVELVSAIDKIIQDYKNSLIILENNDSISGNVIGSTSQEIDIIDDEFVKINNTGGILIKNTYDIYTFDYLITRLMNLNFASYSYNKDSASDLSKEKDIIAINITNQGRVYITFNGNTSEKLNLIDIRNFLLKSYYPRKENESVISYELTNDDLECLLDYELEYLEKKYKSEKNLKMYFKVKKELSKRYREKKRDNKKYREEKQKVRIKKMEEE